MLALSYTRSLQENIVAFWHNFIFDANLILCFLGYTMAGFHVIATIATITTDKAERSLRSGVSIRSLPSTLQRCIEESVQCIPYAQTAQAA